MGLGLLTLSKDAEPVKVLFEATLALVLFTDALSVQSKALRRDDFLPIRLLAVGLPLTIALGWLFAWMLLPGLNIWEMALLGVILAPTDAALGQSAISNPGVPAVVRQGLNVESGLNDGMSLPFFVLLLAAAAGHESAQGPGEAFFRALVLSAVLGVAVGWGAAIALRWSAAVGWVEGQWRHILVIAAAMAAYGLAGSRHRRQRLHRCLGRWPRFGPCCAPPRTRRAPPRPTLSRTFVTPRDWPRTSAGYWSR